MKLKPLVLLLLVLFLPDLGYAPPIPPPLGWFWSSKGLGPHSVRLTLAGVMLHASTITAMEGMAPRVSSKRGTASGVLPHDPASEAREGPVPRRQDPSQRQNPPQRLDPSQHQNPLQRQDPPQHQNPLQRQDPPQLQNSPQRQDPPQRGQLCRPLPSTPSSLQPTRASGVAPTRAIRFLDPPVLVVLPPPEQDGSSRAQETDETKHRGYAFVAFDDEDVAAAHIQTIKEQHPSGDLLDVGPSPQTLLMLRCPELVKEWPNLLKTREALDQEAAEAATRELKAAHRKRKKKRDSKDRVSNIEGVLSAVPPPAGLKALNVYQPICTDERMVEDIRKLIDWACRTSVGVRFQNIQSAPLQADTTLGGTLDTKLSTTLGTTRDASSEGLPQPSTTSPLPGPDSATGEANSATGLVPEPDSATGTPNSATDLETQSQYRIVEFGSGSGNLILPLATAFPHCLFHAVDFNQSAIEILQERTVAARLTNLTASVGRIEDYEESFDVALALHACGNATDYALIQSQLNRAAFICSPCCIGKLKFSPSLCGSENSESSRAEEEGSSEGGSVPESESEGASTRLRIQRAQVEGGSELGPGVGVGVGDGVDALLGPPYESRKRVVSADISHTKGHSHADLAVLAKLNLELDRTMAAKEEGYTTAIVKLLQPELLPYKADVLIGAPNERLRRIGAPSVTQHTQNDASPMFRWPWKHEDRLL
eukprot:gene25371-11032_t